MGISTNGNNYGKYTNSELDALMDKVANESDVNTRWQEMIDAEKIMMDDLCYIPVFEKGTATLQNKDVKGLVIRPVGVPYTCLLYTSEQLIGQLKNVIIDSYDEMLIGRVV